MLTAKRCSALLLAGALLSAPAAFAQRTAVIARTWQPVSDGVSLWSGAIERTLATKASGTQQAQQYVRPSLVDLQVIRVDPAKARVRVIDVYKTSVGGSKGRPAGFDLTSVVRLSTNAIAVLNGGATTSYSIPNHAGFLKTAGRVSKPLVLNSTTLTGMFCVRNTTGTSWAIERVRADLSRLCQEGLQAGPLLVEAGKLAVFSNELQRPAHRRSAICVDRQQNLYLAATSEVNLYDLAKWLVTDPKSSSAGLGCSWALNLDGGTSSGLWLRGRAQSFGETTSTIASALVIERR